MPGSHMGRRAFGLLLVAAAAATGARRSTTFTLQTFGDSILDCGQYNPQGVQPGGLLLRNDDGLFPEFRGRDLQSRRDARLEHLAVDGATVHGLAAQAERIAHTDGPGAGLLTVGGNDLIRGLAADTGPGLRHFESTLRAFLRAAGSQHMLIATVYDPTFGDDGRNFLGVPAAVARANHRRVNQILGEAAARHGALVDLHAHFLMGDPSWFTNTIEPSLRGASEVRRAFVEPLLLHAAA